MKNILENKYLCVIGVGSDMTDFKVGIYNKERESFSFSNGSYSDTELFREPRGGNATYVMSATSLSQIDEANLLYIDIY